MIRFDYPELLVLVVPAVWFWRRYARNEDFGRWIRLVIVLLLVTALAVPRLNLSGNGQDLILVVDRSLSMPEGSENNIRELIRDLEVNCGPDDRISIVTFGSRAQVERELAADVRLQDYTRPVDANGSDLNDALEVALDRRTDSDRAARIIVLSDGVYNGPSPLYAARRAREENVPIDFREFPRAGGGDIAIESVELPRETAHNEPFQFAVVVHADSDSSGTVIVRRNGAEIARIAKEFPMGTSRIYFRDRIPDGGIHQFTAELVAEGGSAIDPVMENNTGAGVVRVKAEPRVLLVTPDGDGGNVLRALQSARIPVDVVTAIDFPMTLDSLDGYGCVFLENVPAGELGRQRMERLAQYVEDLGGGLVMSGGQQTFANGGYYQSPLDKVLPVSLHSIEESRRSRAAIVIVLDRSGSMTAEVGNNKTKMDLANLGAAECVKLLSPQDMVGIIAVDSEPHVVQPMIHVTDAKAINERVLDIESRGGGIFVYTALVAAGSEMGAAHDYITRHIILFSDAADSEEPDDYVNLLAKFSAAGITVSVIGLGRDTDVDAEFLKDIATRGKGNIMFTDDPLDLPRLFAEDAITMTGNMFVNVDPNDPSAWIAGALHNDLRTIGVLPAGPFPKVSGYNWTFLKAGAKAGALSTDENTAPFSAFWHRGLGRVAAIPVELDGRFSGDLPAWPQYDEFVAMHVRWAIGERDQGNVWTSITQDGLDAVVAVELDPDRPGELQNAVPELVVLPPGHERVEPVLPDLHWTGPHTLEGRFRLTSFGTWRTLVRLSANEFSPGPALTLPYSPEFLPDSRNPDGKATLQSLASVSNGVSRVDLLDVLAERRTSRGLRNVLPWLVLPALCLLIVEIAGRRWQWWERLFDRSSRSEKAMRREHAQPEFPLQTTRAPDRKQVLAGLQLDAKPEKAADSAKPATPRPGEADRSGEKSAADVFARAKDKARTRIQ